MVFEEFRPEELLGPLNEVEKKNAPAVLFVSGDTSLSRRRRVSVVGSRKATRDGLVRARSLALELVKRHVVVVSGLAEGIDTAAHQAAIEAGGKTIAILGTPLDKTFPAKNRALQDLIVRDHLAISQFAAGYPARRENFPMRNRTMALLSDATDRRGGRDKRHAPPGLGGASSRKASLSHGVDCLQGARVAGRDASLRGAASLPRELGAPLRAPAGGEP